MRISFVLTAGFIMVIAMLSPLKSYAGSVDDGNSNFTNTGGFGVGPSGATCNLDAYNESLFGTESAASGGYEALNVAACANGKYQFVESTARGLKAFQNAPAECKGLCKRGAGLNRVECASVQEAMQYEFTMNNLAWLKANCPAAVTAVANGTPQNGYKVRDFRKVSVPTCGTTWSGVLAGAHLGGQSGICSTLRTGKDVDDARFSGGRSGTSRLGYVCAHKELPVPGEQCSPPNFDYPDGSGGNTPYNPGPATPWEGEPPLGAPSLDEDQRLKSIWVSSLQQMTNQLVTTIMQQAQVIGSFFDAKHQLETQRLLQQKSAEAHKRYQPSEELCKIGTFARNLNNSEERTILHHVALSQSMMARAMKTGEVTTTSNIGSNESTKQKQYLEKFCSQSDNAGQMTEICENVVPSDQQGANINFTQLIGASLTLDVNLLDNTATNDEATLASFMDLMFMQNAFPWISKPKTDLAAFVEPFMEMRSLIAISSVAQNSINYMVSQKVASTPEDSESAAPFLKAMMVDMGVAPNEIENLIGENPSYYAQMEFLTRKIYYHPEFVSNLYDKPDNVKRMAAAMTAIKSMQNWQISEALERREMLYSVLLELNLRDKQRELETVDIPSVLYGQPDLIGP